MVVCSEMVAGRYFLAFDHHDQLEPGVMDRELILDAVELAAREVPVSRIGVLVDPRYGRRVMERVRALGVTLGISAGAFGDRVGQPRDCDAVTAEVLAAEPDIVKVLVQHDEEAGEATTDRLRVLSDLLVAERRQFLIHLLVPPTERQLERVAGDLRAFEEDLRPGLICRAIGQLQDAGVDPTTWKVEGVYRRSDAEAVALTARRGGRDSVDCVLLGAGASVDRVNRWLRVAAEVDGFVGFAIGRSIWRRFVERHRVGEIDRDSAVAGIAGAYSRFIDVFADPRNAGIT